MKILQHAKDFRVRKEWGSNEFLIINEEYVPTP
jgi:hypothetical protein